MGQPVRTRSTSTRLRTDAVTNDRSTARGRFRSISSPISSARRRSGPSSTRRPASSASAIPRMTSAVAACTARSLRGGTGTRWPPGRIAYPPAPWGTPPTRRSATSSSTPSAVDETGVETLRGTRSPWAAVLRRDRPTPRRRAGRGPAGGVGAVGIASPEAERHGPEAGHELDHVELSGHERHDTGKDEGDAAVRRLRSRGDRRPDRGEPARPDDRSVDGSRRTLTNAAAGPVPVTALGSSSTAAGTPVRREWYRRGGRRALA